MSDIWQHGGWQDGGRSVDRRMALAGEWDELVERVRALPGFADFLRPPDLVTLLPAAERGPVVVVNVSQRRCDALIIRRSGVTACPLSDLTAQDVADRANHYLETLQAAEDAAERLDAARARRGGGMSARQAVQRAEREVADVGQVTEGMLAELVEWLWDTVAEPVLAELGFDGTPARGSAWPRMWWCPTGPLTLLPLHAAGHHTAPGSSPPRTVIDRVVSSYTPTLRALLEARKPINEGLRADDRLLTVGVPDTPGQRHLGGVAGELATLAELVPAARRTDLVGERANRHNVRDQLPRHRWAHFSEQLSIPVDEVLDYAASA